MFGVDDIYIYGAVGLIVIGLGGVVYIEHERNVAANARADSAEHDRDIWKNNYTEAARVADANKAALEKYKNLAAASTVAADVAAAVAADNDKKYRGILEKVREQHAPGDSSPYMRAFLDELCRAQTTAACGHY